MGPLEIFCQSLWPMVQTTRFDDLSSVPINLPSQPSNIFSPLLVTGPLVWTGADFQSDAAYSLRLSEQDIEEIDHALASFKSLGLDGQDVSHGNFPLPTLSRRLRSAADSLYNGQGFFVIRGIPEERYSVPDGCIVYLGIASYIGEQRGRQDSKGNMLCMMTLPSDPAATPPVWQTVYCRTLTGPAHITDCHQSTVPADHRHGIHTSAALPFHTDMGCDILALQVRHSAAKGGHVYLSSAGAVLNDLQERNPVVVETLMKPNWPVWISVRRGSYCLTPVMTIHDGKLMISLDTGRLGPPTGAMDSPVPMLTAAQVHALQAVSEAASRSELRLDLRSGDMLFGNNLALMHRRDTYVDNSRSSRHLVRLWLRNQELGWRIPDSLMTPWTAAYGTCHGNKAERYVIYPMAEYVAPKYTTSSAAFVMDDSESSEGE